MKQLNQSRFILFYPFQSKLFTAATQWPIVVMMSVCVSVCVCVLSLQYDTDTDTDTNTDTDTDTNTDMTFDEGQPLMECDLLWKTNSGGRQPSLEDDLRWMMP